MTVPRTGKSGLRTGTVGDVGFASAGPVAVLQTAVDLRSPQSGAPEHIRAAFACELVSVSPYLVWLPPFATIASLPETDCC